MTPDEIVMDEELSPNLSVKYNSASVHELGIRNPQLHPAVKNIFSPILCCFILFLFLLRENCRHK